MITARQAALTTMQIAWFPREVSLSRQVVLTLRQLALFTPKQAVFPRQVALLCRLTTPPRQLVSTISQGFSRIPTQNRGKTLEDPNLKWVINLPSKPLTQVQSSLLVKGPNFVVSPRHSPNLEYITAIESVCTKFDQQEVEELRADINRVLRSSHPPNLI